jgi:hypothetical protein
MASKATTDPVESLRDCDDVDVIPIYNALVVQVHEDATTAGPAMDPVEVWADHQSTYNVYENDTSAGGYDSYTVKEA